MTGPDGGPPHAPALQWEAYQENTWPFWPPPRCAPGTALAPDAFVRQPLLLREKGSGTREEFDREMEAVPTPAPVESVSNTALLQAAAAGLGLAASPARWPPRPSPREGGGGGRGGPGVP
ncbi:MAG: LysR substrate-binding domain-containing protein [Evtepia sp.]